MDDPERGADGKCANGSVAGQSTTSRATGRTGVSLLEGLVLVLLSYGLIMLVLLLVDKMVHG